MKSINPYNKELIAEYKLHTDQEVKKIIEEVDQASRRYALTSFDERAKLLKSLAKILRENVDEYAKLMTSEVGKLFKDSKSEIEKCASTCDYYAENGAKYLGDEGVVTGASKSYITYQPLGTLLAVMPWNFPFWQVFRFAVPALFAGNGFVLKHASNVTGSSLLLEKIFLQAGFPENLVRSLIIDSKHVASVIANPTIKALSLTGSTEAGRSVAAKAAEYLKKAVLELGGSDPYLILEDADLDFASAVCARTRLINCGQSCISGKRFIVVKKVYEEFIDKFKLAMSSYIMGDPMDQKTGLPPLASHFHRDNLHRQVIKSVEQGARLVLGGKVPEEVGAFYPATILADVTERMPAFNEELFGPVASVIMANTEDEAIRLANTSSYGLGAGVFTKDLERGEHIAKNLLEAGSCFVNEFVRSDPRLPFGGIKESGYGRELSEAGIREFVNIKTVYIR